MIPSDNEGFTEEQKQYLDAFLRGIAARAGGAPAGDSAPSDIHRAAQDRFIAAGKKLVAEEEVKRKGHPLDMWDELMAEAAEGRFPKGTDVFRHKFFGLFYAAPAQNAFMCRLRMPNGILMSYQLRAVADIAEAHAGGYADVTTRANLQLREIMPQSILAVLTAVTDAGLTSRGAGADNIRNITGSPTAGIDPQELVDTRPLARTLHHYILNHRELYGLPRKFNIAFDGGGRIGVLEDTNDIGFAAVAVPEGSGVPAGVYFRMQLGGITGHGDFGRDAGVLLTPEECVPVAVAVVRVFIAHGNRTDRKRARLKYVIEAMGLAPFMAAVDHELGRKLTHFGLEACVPRGPVVKHGHVGVHPQRQLGLNYLGVVLPVGRLIASQMRGLANVAATYGSGTIRLTVWQNLLISDVPDASVPAAKAAIEALGLGLVASAVRGGLVACTGNTGCKFAATDTKGQAMALADYLDRRVALDRPINIHLTGCPNSCAQHYVGDIGLLGVKIGNEMVEGYAVLLGGGAGGERALAREIYSEVSMADLPGTIERMLKGYIAHRRDGESFHDFTARYPIETLRALFDTADGMAA